MGAADDDDRLNPVEPDKSMPETSVDPGETKELYRAQRARESLFIRNKGSEAVNIAKSESFARDGREIDADDRGDLVFVERDEPVHVHAPSSNSGPVTVQYESQGFFINYAPRNRIRTTLEDVTVANVPIDIDTVTADVPIKLASGISELDVNLNASTIDVPIKTGSAGNIDINVNRDTSLGRVEVALDQTATISAGGSQTTQQFADAGEIWELRQAQIDAPVTSLNDAGSVAELRTTEQGIEVLHGEDNDGNTDMTYQSGTWVSGANVRADVRALQIDDTNGIEFFCNNGDGDTSWTDNRLCRLIFEVVDN